MSQVGVLWLLAILIIGVVAFFIFKGQNNTSLSSKNQQALLITHNINMSEGATNAPVKMVEYADFLCPYCSKFAHSVMPQIKQNYIDTNKVHLEFRPVAIITGDSERAAEGAYCAAEQGKFWNYYQAAYDATWNGYYAHGVKPAQVPIFRGSALMTIAKSAQLNTTQFMSCLDSGKYGQAVAKSTKAFENSGFNGTPAFIINSTHYTGYAPYNEVAPVIDSFLK